MRIADIKDRDDLTLHTDRADADMACNDWPEVFDLGCDCDSFFIRADNGEFTEVYGFRGTVPALEKSLHVHLVRGSATLVAS